MYYSARRGNSPVKRTNAPAANASPHTVLQMDDDTESNSSGNTKRVAFIKLHSQTSISHPPSVCEMRLLFYLFVLFVLITRTVLQVVIRNSFPWQSKKFCYLKQATLQHTSGYSLTR